MSSLTGKTPSATYKSLLKIDGENQEVDATKRSITDGVGNPTGISIDNTGTLHALAIDVDNIETGTVGRISATSLVIDDHIATDSLKADGDLEADGDVTFNSSLYVPAGEVEIKNITVEESIVTQTLSVLGGSSFIEAVSISDDLDIDSGGSINIDNGDITVGGNLEVEECFLAEAGGDILITGSFESESPMEVGSGSVPQAATLGYDFEASGGGIIALKGITVAPTPDTGESYIYPKASDGKLYYTTSFGTPAEREILTDASTDFVSAASGGAFGGSISVTTVGTSNTVYGTNAGESLVSGTAHVNTRKNVFIGYDCAIATLDEAMGNTGVGEGALAALTEGTYNTAIGRYALNDTTDGIANVAVGSSALGKNISAIHNTAVGHFAGYAGETSEYNTWMGYFAGYYNFSGSFNTSIGAQSSLFNQFGDHNVALGYYALHYNESGDNTIAIGSNAGSITPPSTQVTDANECIMIGRDTSPGSATPTNEIIIGHDADGGGDNTVTIGNASVTNNYLTGQLSLSSYGSGTYTGTAAKYLAVDSSGNIIEEASAGGATEIDGLSDGATDATNVSLGLGTGALAGDIDKPTYNVAIGYNALNASPDGEYNVAIGYTALLVNDADSNTAIGAFALSSNSSGDSNMAIGRLALTNNLGGNNNMAVGKACMHRNTSGSSNSTMGHQALYYNQDGSSNVAIGHQAGEHTGASAWVTTATQCVIIGSDADFNTTTPTNEMVFGYATDGIGDNGIAMGNTSILNAEAQVSWTTYSDERIKRNIEDTDLGLDFISALRPVRFQKVNPADYPEAILERRFKRRVTQHDDEDEVVREPDERPADNDSWNHGLVAQEVKAALDSLGIESDIWSQSPNGKQGVKYEALVVPLIKAVQELSSRVIELEK